MKIIRVFPRKTSASPDDDLVRFDYPTMFDECDEVHVSVTFDSDKDIAEKILSTRIHGMLVIAHMSGQVFDPRIIAFINPQKLAYFSQCWFWFARKAF